MGQEFEKVTEDDFLTFKPGCKPTYTKIEEALIGLGGGGLEGNRYKKTCLEKAGWTYGKLIAYGAHPDKAAAAFNRLRDALALAEEKEQLLDMLH